MRETDRGGDGAASSAKRGPLLSEFVGDPDMMELVAMFVEELPQRIAMMEAEWRDARVTELTRIVHQLKGAGAGYGYPSISEAAASLEAMLRTCPSRDGLESCRACFDELIDLCRRATE